MCMAYTLSHRGERLRDMYRAGKKVGTAPSGGNGFWEGLKARVFGRCEAVRKGGGIEAEGWEVSTAECGNGEKWVLVGGGGVVEDEGEGK